MCGLGRGHGGDIEKVCGLVLRLSSERSRRKKKWRRDGWRDLSSKSGGFE